MQIKQDLNEDIYSSQENLIELTESGKIRIILSGDEYRVSKLVNRDSLVAFLRQIQLEKSEDK